ncbi:MAG: hypothetical protein ABIR24_11330, partial [Verrucomicrobiota bacterium]
MTQARRSELQQLFSRVQHVTHQRGKKTALANFLGVLPQQLNNWISEINEPGGEVTLQLLEWVTAEEAQQNKNRETVEAVSRRKTRSRKPSQNENPKSNP